MLAGSCLAVGLRLLIGVIGIVDSLQEGTTGNGRGGDGIYLSAILGYYEGLGRCQSDDAALAVGLEPFVGLGTQSRCLSMFQEGIAQDGAVGIESYEDAQLTAEAVGSALYGSTEVLLVGILGVIDDESQFLAFIIWLLHGVGAGDG